MLIGNLTRDPELRYTPSGAAVVSFSIATNRSWTTDTGEKKDEVDFHNIVAWRKLAEICSQFLTKGRKVYVQGRLTTRNWTGQDGSSKTRTEVVIDDMILLDNKGAGAASSSEEGREEAPKKTVKKSVEPETHTEEAPAVEAHDEETVAPDDIPF